MTTSTKRPLGRPPCNNKATKLVTIKMTPAQHAMFLELGGSRWVKKLISDTTLKKTPP